jgi:hypothetical protein
MLLLLRLHILVEFNCYRRKKESESVRIGSPLAVAASRERAHICCFCESQSKLVGQPFFACCMRVHTAHSTARLAVDPPCAFPRAIGKLHSPCNSCLWRHTHPTHALHGRRIQPLRSENAVGFFSIDFSSALRVRHFSFAYSSFILMTTGVRAAICGDVAAAQFQFANDR